MLELTERKSPKNIRQIGEPGQGNRVYIEDYAYTYLHQLARDNLTCVKTVILTGQAKEGAIYIQGALEIDMGQEPKGWFTNEHWRDIFQTIQKWFDGLEVVGWALANPGFPPVLTEELKAIHRRNFSGDQYVFFQMDVLENEEVFYAGDGAGMAPLCGYYVYYEKNEQMQAYMSDKRGGAGIEPEGILRDKAAVRFRSVMQEKKEQSAQRKTVAFLYTACTFLVMVILVIGITMINNYDRMESMESTLYQISESLQEPEDGTEPASEQTMEEAVEEENRQALETAEETSENTEQDEKTPEEETPEESQEQEEDQQEVQEVLSQAVQEPESYVVQEGDTLLAICRRKYGSDDMVEEICDLNQLENGDKILAGEIILLP